MRVSLRLRWLVAAFVCAFLAVIAACSGSGSSTGVPPITGIVIRAETLTTGRGCGRGPTQLFKYAAIVYGYTDGPADVKGSYRTPVTAGVYDCFADGTFVQLPAIGGSFTFRLEVFAYTEAAYLASRDAIENAGTNGDALRATAPTWTTVCTATQLQDVQALAVCDPLVTGFAESTIILRTGAFSRMDGLVSVCGRTTTDGGILDGGDAGDAADGASDAEAGADADAGGDAGTTSGGTTFLTVRASARSGGAEVVPPTDVACPDTFVVHDAIANATYEIDVTLLGAASETVGTTKCTAQAVAGTETAATCAPVR